MLGEVKTFDQLFASLPQDFRNNLLNNPDFQAFINELYSNNNPD